MYYLYEMVLGGWVHKCFAKKNIFGGDNIQHIAPKVKKKICCYSKDICGVYS